MVRRVDRLYRRRVRREVANMCEGEHGKNHIQFFVKNFCNVKILVECCYWLPRAGGITSCTNNNV